MKEILLRELTLADAKLLSEYANNKSIWDNLRDFFPYPYQIEQAEEFIEFVLKTTPRQNFAIRYGGHFVGIMGIHPFDDIYRKTAELGYWIGEPYWGKGIITAAIPLILKYGWDELNLNRIQASVFEYNRASMKALEKSGFIKEGVMRKRLIKNDQYFDEHLYAVLRST